MESVCPHSGGGGVPALVDFEHYTSSWLGKKKM
jgi:hypothetical protein